jgi:uncharacterized membrane protein (DUF373 family)
MDDDFKRNLVITPIKVLATIIAFMILMRFGYVFYDFIQNPFHEPIILNEGAVIHVMTALILLELFALTLQFLIQEVIDPNIILITVLTVLGRDIIVINLQEIDYTNLIAIGVLFAVTISGLYLLKIKE